MSNECTCDQYPFNGQMRMGTGPALVVYKQPFCGKQFIWSMSFDDMDHRWSMHKKKQQSKHLEQLLLYT